MCRAFPPATTCSTGQLIASSRPMPTCVCIDRSRLGVASCRDMKIQTRGTTVRSGLTSPGSRASSKGHAGADELYGSALELARKQLYNEARDTFETLLSQHPHLCKAWVSYAQMEKRMNKHRPPYGQCREILQRGMLYNPSSACLAQAWGLMELQRGNLLGAIKLLERCVTLDPNLSPVLSWAQVQTARQTVGNRKREACN